MEQKEYIEKEAVKGKISPALNDPEVVDFWEWQCSLIDEIPAADVREVVMCRDCYAYQKDPELARAAYLDPERYCAILRVEMPEEGYCWYGRPNCGADMRGK